MSVAKRGPSGALSSTRVWVVEPGARFSLGDVLRRLGHARGALENGRVFVDGCRALDARLRLEVGQRVELHPARRGGGEASVLDERDGLVVALKPPGLPTEPDHHGLDSLRADVAEALGAPESTLHAVSRLDVGVSGVVLFARTGAARRHVESVRKRGELRRRYVGLVEGVPEPRGGSWDDAIATAPRGRARVAGRGAGGLPAETRYVVLGEVETPLRSVGRHAREVAPALLVFEPVTGRTHQIRVHAASARVPLLGDRLYGGALSLVLPDGRVVEASRIALHATWVELPDLYGHVWRVQAPRPPDLLRLWHDLGGHVEPWERGDDDQVSGLPARVE